jgi:hypothetical protein
MGPRWGYGDERAVGDAVPPIPPKTAKVAPAKLEHGCESHPPSWAVHGGTRPQQHRREAGLDAEEDEQTGRNESEPQVMSLDISQTGDKPSPSSLGEGRWERVGQPPVSAQRSGGVCVDSTSGRQARVTCEDSGDGR